MDYGFNKRLRKLVHAADAVRTADYACPTCGHPVELRRGPSLEYFAHWRGIDGTDECEFFVPGHGGSRHHIHTEESAEALVEDDPAELGLILNQDDGEWSLALRVPEIPQQEIGVEPLASLRRAVVEIVTGSAVVSRISAVELRPGVGVGRVFVPPSLQEYCARPIGTWPHSVKSQRWNLRCPEVRAMGVLFRLRSGEWTRLIAESGVQAGETVLVLADERCLPPERFVRQEHARIASGALTWRIWELALPDEADHALSSWLDRVGHHFVSRPWNLRLASPPRAYSERGEPIFWLGDSAVFAVEAPTNDAETLATFVFGSNSQGASIGSGAGHQAQLVVTSHTAGLTRLSLADDRKATVGVMFAPRPRDEAVAELFHRTLRLRVRVGELCFDAWQASTHVICVDSKAPPEVEVNLGHESVCARVTLWEGGRLRSQRSLSGREVAATLQRGLQSASRIEIDAENLGRIEFTPRRASASERAIVSDRLAWREHILNAADGPSPHAVHAISRHPRLASALVCHSVDAAGLMRSRIALKRRRQPNGGSQ
jgi:hypothetical protein